MTPSARVQAAIEILDEVIASARDDGPPADAIVQRYFKTRRYAGSKDRRAVRELVYRAIRRSGERPDERPGGDAWAGRRRCGVGGCSTARRMAASAARRGELAPAALLPGMDRGPTVAAWCPTDEWPALLERAPLDLGSMAPGHRATRWRQQFDGAEPTRLSPGACGCRPTRGSMTIPHSPQGLVEVQDEGSQLIALACKPPERHRHPRSVRRRRRQVAGACRGGAEAEIIACDTNRARLAQLGPARRARRGEYRDTAARRRAGSGAARRPRRAVPTSCWSMRRAAGRAPGAATRKGAGG